MKIKRLLILAVLPMMCLAANAQNCSKDNTPKKGDFTVAATVGYNSYTNVTAPSGLLTDYEVRALSTNWADKKLMVGFEGGWFFKDQWKLNLGGGVSFTNNPGYPAVPGTIDDSNKNNSADENMGEIPNYRAVADAQSFAYNVSAGVDRYFNLYSIKKEHALATDEESPFKVGNAKISLEIELRPDEMLKLNLKQKIADLLEGKGK